MPITHPRDGAVRSGSPFRCPVCLGTDCAALLADTCRRCTGCGLVLQTTLPADPLHLYTRDGYDDARTRLDGPTALPVFARFNHDLAVAHLRLDQLEDVLPPGGHRWLDYGCGSGATLSAARRVGFATVVGLELDPAFCREVEAVVGVPVHPSRLLNHPDRFRQAFKDFSVVSAFDVLEHCFDPVALVCRLGRVVEKGGVLVLEVPDIGCLADLERELPSWHHYKPGQHLTHWSLPPLARLLDVVAGDGLVFEQVRAAAPVPGKLQVVWKRIR